MANSFAYSTYISTTPEQLWEALISPQFTKQYWMGTVLESDWQVGSSIRLLHPKGTEMKEKYGKVVAYDPPKLLSYTGIGGANSTVTFELIQLSPNQVRLNITHEDIEPEFGKGVAEGWYAIISNLKTFLETGKLLDYSWWRG
ncbi:MAG TPA: SRPBCC domain-containing protein [Candidatus Kapabacteria bacterium]|nr:SRPBCC domain-containing protein [Candidatus Kapabacteria bacterium]